jgi:hypothetical protein
MITANQAKKLVKIANINFDEKYFINIIAEQIEHEANNGSYHLVVVDPNMYSFRDKICTKLKEKGFNVTEIGYDRIDFKIVIDWSDLNNDLE